MNRIRKNCCKLVIFVIFFATTILVHSKEVEAVTSDEFIQYARQYIGTPYVSAGRSPSGFDCCGFVYYVCNHFGIDIGNGNQQEQRNYGQPVAYDKSTFQACIANMQVGDLVFFDYQSDGYSDHVAIYTGNGNAINAESGGVLEHTMDQGGWPGGKMWYSICAVRRVYASPIANTPQGVFDVAEGGNGTVRVRGWVFDRDDVNASVKVHVYIGGVAGTGEGHEITANKGREDVGNAYPGVGNYHGFDEVIETNKRGSQEVHVYGIDVGTFVRNPELSNSPKTVVINEKAEYPIDLNGYLDGEESGSISGYGTADVYVNGSLIANDVDDFYSINGTWVTGSSYEIKDIKPKPGYSYNGVHSGSRSGTIGESNVTVSLDFTRNHLDSITEKPQAKYYNGHTYFYYSSPATWYFAKEFCEMKGGHLISIKSAEEDAFALSLFEQGENVWIGAYDETVEGSWIWSEGGSVTYTNWADGNPDNYSGTTSDRENYVHYNSSSKWNDNNGTNKYSFVCEFDFIDHEHSLIKVPAKDATCETDGNLAYWFCDICDNVYSDAEANNETTLSSTVISKLGHDYLVTENPPTCIDNGSTTYTCSRCGDSYTETVPVTEPEGSDSWSTEKPTGVPEDMIYAKTQYQYRDLQKTTSSASSMTGWTQTGSSTSYGSYGAWSGWSETPQSGSDTREVQTRTEYRYYYFYCPVCGGHEPLQGISDCHQYTLSLSDGVVGWFPTSFGDCNPQTYSYTTAKRWTTSLGDGQRWNLSTADIGHTDVGYQGDAGTPIIRTAYRYRDRSKTITYSYEKWGEWSEWGYTKYTASSTREVETRTVYKYDVERDNRHQWDDPVYEYDETDKTLKATYTCTLNAKHTKIEIIENVQALKLPAQLKEIGEEAFAGLPCQVVIIPDGCTTIGSRTFADCDELLYVEIPPSVTEIADDAFEGCDKYAQ